MCRGGGQNRRKSRRDQFTAFAERDGCGQESQREFGRLLKKSSGIDGIGRKRAATNGRGLCEAVVRPQSFGETGAGGTISPSYAGVSAKGCRIEPGGSRKTKGRLGRIS